MQPKFRTGDKVRWTPEDEDFQPIETYIAGKEDPEDPDLFIIEREGGWEKPTFMRNYQHKLWNKYWNVPTKELELLSIRNNNPKNNGKFINRGIELNIKQ